MLAETRFVAVLISSVLLLVWDIGIGGHWFAYLIGTCLPSRKH
jgi:hypothetical protein